MSEKQPAMRRFQVCFAPGGAKVGHFVGRWSRSGWKSETSGYGGAVGGTIDAGQDGKTEIVAWTAGKRRLLKYNRKQRLESWSGLRSLPSVSGTQKGSSRWREMAYVRNIFS